MARKPSMTHLGRIPYMEYGVLFICVMFRFVIEKSGRLTILSYRAFLPIFGNLNQSFTHLDCSRYLHNFYSTMVDNSSNSTMLQTYTQKLKRTAVIAGFLVRIRQIKS